MARLFLLLGRYLSSTPFVPLLPSRNPRIEGTDPRRSTRRYSNFEANGSAGVTHPHKSYLSIAWITLDLSTQHDLITSKFSKPARQLTCNYLGASLWPEG